MTPVPNESPSARLQRRRAAAVPSAISATFADSQPRCRLRGPPPSREQAIAGNRSALGTPTAPARLARLQLPLWMLSPRDADAAQLAPGNDDGIAKLQQLAKKLKRLIVSAPTRLEYRGDYDELLQYGAMREVDDENIDARFRPVYLRMVKATAWQESCWRQFVLDGNRITYLESSTHDLGVMQVNKYVWRGFYNVNRLEWDVLYNASAGMEILARLLGDLESKRGAFSAQNPDETIALGLRGLQRRSRRVSALAHARAPDAARDRQLILAEVPVGPARQSDRDPHLRRGLGPATLKRAAVNRRRAASTDASPAPV